MILLEFFAANRALVDVHGAAPVRIWSGQWNAWWRPLAAGCTTEIERAGVYPLASAYERTDHCGREKQIRFDPVTPLPGQDQMVLPPPAAPPVDGCYACTRQFLATGQGCGERHWKVRSYGFDDRVYGAPTANAAKYRDFKAGREAGYFSGGFHAYLVSAPQARELVQP